MVSIAPDTPPYIFDVDPSTVFTGLVPIGAGASGTVYRAADAAHGGRTVAVKRVTPADAAAAAAVAAEVAMAATTRHPCLLKAWETYVWRGEWWLATEWMDGGAVTGLIAAAAAAGAALPERIIAYVLREVLEGLAYMHGGGRMHPAHAGQEGEERQKEIAGPPRHPRRPPPTSTCCTGATGPACCPSGRPCG